MNSDHEDKIKLLRNLCRILGLSCVLASTNAKVNNLLNINKNHASAPRENSIWVYAIRKLPKANVKAVLSLLNWAQYANCEDSFDTEGLLNDLGIQYNLFN